MMTLVELTDTELFQGSLALPASLVVSTVSLLVAIISTVHVLRCTQPWNDVMYPKIAYYARIMLNAFVYIPIMLILVQYSIISSRRENFKGVALGYTISWPMNEAQTENTCGVN